MGSSFVFSCETVQEGVIRRSAERSGGPEGLVSLGTMICIGRSEGVCSDIVAGSAPDLFVISKSRSPSLLQAGPCDSNTGAGEELV